MTDVEYKFHEGDDVLVLSAPAKAEELVGTKQTIKRQIQFITKVPGVDGTHIGDWIAIPGYELVGNKACFREEFLQLWEDKITAVTDDEFDSLFG